MNEIIFKDIDNKTLKKYKHLKSLGKFLISKRRYHNAEDTLKAAFELYKSDPELMILMGHCYYGRLNINEALKFYEASYELDNSIPETSFMIGRILMEKQQYLDAVYYFQQYVNDMDFEMGDEKDIEKYIKKAEGLMHLGYCYYYMDDYLNSQYYFNESLKFYPRSKECAKYLSNIKDRQEGKSVRKIDKYRNYYVSIKDVNTDDLITKEVYTIHPGKVIKTIISLILAIISIIGFIDHLKDRNSSSDNESRYESAQESNSNAGDNLITTTHDYLGVSYNMPVSMKFDDVKSTDYYELSKPFQEKIIYSKDEIDKNDWWNNTACRIYTGNLDGSRFIFSVPLDECDRVDKKGKYNVDGAKLDIERDAYDKIVEETVNTKRYVWVFGGYVTSQKNMVSQAQDTEISSYINDNGETLKVINSQEEFENNNYHELQSVYLTEITPLDYFLCRITEGNYNLLSYNEIKSQKIDMDLCTRMYCGRLGNIEVAFVDPDFSMASIDDKGGHRIEGIKSCMGRSTQTVGVEQNYGGRSTADIYWWYIDCAQ